MIYDILYMVIFMWKIGNVEIKNRVVLAPMAGVCNSAFRRIAKEMGCGLIYAEMVSDKAIFYKCLQQTFLPSKGRIDCYCWCYSRIGRTFWISIKGTHLFRQRFKCMC